MKTILEVTGKMNRGGAETMLVDIIKKTYKDFNYIFLINEKSDNKKGDYDEILKKYNCKFYYIGTVWNMGISAYTKEFIKICNEIKEKYGNIDVIHCHMNSKCGTVLRAAKKAGIERRIAHSHAEIKFNGNIIRVLANYSELYFQKFLINKYATDYWGCSEKSLPSLYSKKNIKSKKCKIIKNAIEIQKFVDVKKEEIEENFIRLGVPQDKIIIGTVGRIAKVKNVKFIVEVFKKLYEENKNICLVIVGDEQDKEYTKELKELISEYNLKNEIIFTGVQENLEKIYPMFNIFLGASLREGLGLVAVEAQASKIPCVLSTGFPKEVDINLGLVDFIDNYDVEKWVQAIEISLNKERKIDTKQVIGKLTDCGYNILEEVLKVKQEYERNSIC